MSNSKEDFEDYQEGGGIMSDMSKFIFSKNKPDPTPPQDDPFANVQLLATPTMLAQQRAAEAERQRAAEDAKRQAEEQKKNMDLYLALEQVGML